MKANYDREYYPLLDVRYSPGRVPDSYYLNQALLSINSVDNSTRPADYFSDCHVTKFRNHAPGIRKIG